MLTRENGLWQKIKPWSWQIITITLLLALTMVVLRPLAAGPGDPTAYQIEHQWNESIGRLGIQPVFPPEEDFFVGDVWAVVAGPLDRPFLGKAVRISHLDLRSLITNHQHVPIFTETVRGPPNHELPFQNNKEADLQDDGKIYLTSTAFPGISITHVTKASTFLGLVLGGWNAKRDGLQFEETKNSIPGDIRCLNTRRNQSIRRLV